MNDKQFINGLLAYKPRDTAPDFIKANILVYRDDLIRWLETQGEKIKIDLKESRKGKWYAELNTYTKTPSESWKGRDAAMEAVYGQNAAQSHTEDNNDEIDIDQIPF